MVLGVGGCAGGAQPAHVQPPHTRPGGQPGAQPAPAARGALPACRAGPPPACLPPATAAPASCPVPAWPALACPLVSPAHAHGPAVPAPLPLLQAEAEWAGFASDMQQAQAQPRSSKPGEAAWRAGPHGARLAAVEGLALGTLPLSGPQRNLAIQTLIDLGKTPSGQVGVLGEGEGGSVWGGAGRRGEGRECVGAGRRGAGRECVGAGGRGAARTLGSFGRVGEATRVCGWVCRCHAACRLPPPCGVPPAELAACPRVPPCRRLVRRMRRSCCSRWGGGRPTCTSPW